MLKTIIFSDLFRKHIPIKEIVFTTGFNSESNFTTCFKNNTSVTPSEFRNTPF
ncbi:helix-turn-helix domain-containing protein [Clostridium lacusfryxellense]|uniref:helix-turn-helix domain-containing protein n=1 Tax=Clostridium lacusfryxellense TaxID=205328 RepID=UPI001C0AD9C7|nr:AraC family transcriptional regulator [Clostridium lacusfryxellense]MBU3113291.1 AraC family transcriptional regulator [Clostridium lacusfryxellense]